MASDSQAQFSAERIVLRRTFSGVIKYKLRWKGYGKNDDTWETAEDVRKHFPNLVAEFEASRNSADKSVPKPKVKRPVPQPVRTSPKRATPAVSASLGCGLYSTDTDEHASGDEHFADRALNLEEASPSPASKTPAVPADESESEDPDSARESAPLSRSMPDLEEDNCTPPRERRAGKQPDAKRQRTSGPRTRAASVPQEKPSPKSSPTPRKAAPVRTSARTASKPAAGAVAAATTTARVDGGSAGDRRRSQRHPSDPYEDEDPYPDRVIERVSGAVKTDGTLCLQVYWRGLQERETMPADYIAHKDPFAVIQFYQSRLKFGGQ